jgi:peptidoglycan pentaglycine glycine transferase (the first glycine)
MKATILRPEQEPLWEEFVQNHPLASLHQSPAWGHFQQKIQSRGQYWIVALFEDEKIVGGTMVIRHKIHKNHSWLYCPRGPLLNYDADNINDQLKLITEALAPLAKKENSIFLRVDPPLPKTYPQKFSYFHSTHHGFQPENTLILDLSKSKEEILQQMKSKGRYNIRLAEKKGVKIRPSGPKNSIQFQEDIKSFYDILEQTTQRDKFHGHGQDFYLDMVQTLAINKNATLYLAEYKGKVIAGIISTFYKDTAIYYYGASSNHHRNLMAPYLLQWQAIKDARVQNLTHYDFLGIAPENSKNHPWKGVTDFKKKFGGKTISYLAPREYAFKKITYWLYRVYKFIRS